MRDGRGNAEPWAGVGVGVEFAAVGGVDVAAGGVRLPSVSLCSRLDMGSVEPVAWTGIIASAQLAFVEEVDISVLKVKFSSSVGGRKLRLASI